MALNRRLINDRDFQEALDRRLKIRVFQDDHIVDSDSVIVRFDERTIVTQSSVSELAYHSRAECEFFEIRRR